MSVLSSEMFSEASSTNIVDPDQTTSVGHVGSLLILTFLSGSMCNTFSLISRAVNYRPLHVLKCSTICVFADAFYMSTLRLKNV